jgi:hypothetical protein
MYIGLGVIFFSLFLIYLVITGKYPAFYTALQAELKK